MTAVRTFYICYFGVREPLVQTQVLPYLRELIRKDVRTDGSANIFATLLTFEPKRKASDISEFEGIRAALADEGIGWTWLPYHKRPSAIATAWDVFRGIFRIRRQIGRIDVLHARSHVPALMAALARGLSSKKPKLIFDIRGFMPEEYADAGVWDQNGMMFRIAKRIEKWLMNEADGFVVLTKKAKNILFGSTERRPVEVIPCCVDTNDRFGHDRPRLRNEFRQKLTLSDRFVIVHLGAVGGLYLTNEIVNFIMTARTLDRNVFAMFLTQSAPSIIEPLLRDSGFSESDYMITKIAPNDIAGYLYAGDVGLSFVKSSYATQSRSPTKIPEYLACGLPVIANSGVGDVDELIRDKQVGALVETFNEEGFRSALKAISGLGEIAERCRATAKAEFDLENVGGIRYRRLYSKILE